MILGTLSIDPVNNVRDVKSIWTYDQVGNRLLSKETGVYAGATDSSIRGTFDRGAQYDSQLDRLTTFAVTNQIPEPDSIATSTVTYDNAGNTTAFGGNTYQYDWANRLTNAVVNGNTIRLVYNADGQLVYRKVTTNGVTTTTGFVVDNRTLTGWPQVAEQREYSGGAWNLVTHYAYGLNRFAQIHWDSTYAVETPVYYIHDGIGSARGLVDKDGTLTDVYDYDAWGRLISLRVLSGGSYVPAGSSNPGMSNLFRFTGEQWEPQLKLQYNRARFYDPETGWFWNMESYEGNQPDPLSLHKYLYVDPLTSSPASGRPGSRGLRWRTTPCCRVWT